MEESTGPFCNNIVMVRKKDGKPRMCIVRRPCLHKLNLIEMSEFCLLASTRVRRRGRDLSNYGLAVAWGRGSGQRPN